MHLKREHFTLSLLLLASIALFYLYQPYWMSIVIASLLALSTTHIYNFFLKWTRYRLVASLLSTIVLIVLFFAPLVHFFLGISTLLENVEPTVFDTLYANFSLIFDHTPKLLTPLKNALIENFQHFDSSTLTDNVLEYAGNIGSFAVSFVTNTVFILVFYFFALLYGKEIFEFFKRSAHFPQQESTLIVFEMRASMSVVFYSILATAFFEGTLFGLGVKSMGYDGLLFGIMYGFASLIPVIGGVIMWLPFALFEMGMGNIDNALFITLYTVIVISLIADTFIKPIIIRLITHRFIKNEEQINELIIFFSILAGLSTFGFWGMIIGPAITVLFITLMKISADDGGSDSSESPTKWLKGLPSQS